MAAGTAQDDGVITAPGLGAFLRRHPQLGRRSAIGAIGSGIVLFAVAAISANGAAADIGAPAAVPTTSSYLPPAAPAPPLAAPTSTPTSTQMQQAVHRARRHVSKQAPVTHGVISGLADNGIPRVALNAYRVAAARMATVEPSCGIDWALVAGIGREESDHGQFAGAVLHTDGVSTPRIIGIALDGSRSEAILDTDGGSLDGDPVYDHAVGPMQFIPSTWAIYGTDATGDGRADVFNINDAALSTARYLCAAGGDLRSRAGQVRAVLSYNHSDEYLAQVLALADAYRRGIPVTGIPVGITSGPLPRITDTGYIPPANPGAPPAGHPGGKSKPGTSRPGTPAGSGKPHATSTRSKPAATSARPKPSGTSSTPRPTKSRTTQPTPTKTTPTPSPTPTCKVLDHLLGRC